MSIQQVTKFFMWCTILNGALLLLGIIGTIVAPDLGSNIQHQLFRVPPETQAVVIYSLLGVLKIVWLVFNLVPYVALLIVGRK